jgi:hypothetical protein
MRVVATDPGGEVDAAVLFVFAERENLITASYRGGAIVDGYLIGTRERTHLNFRYVQANTSQRVESGVSTCEIAMSPGGRMQLTEHFRWESKPGRGTNVLEEVDV